MATGGRAVQPTLAGLTAVLPQYGARFDLTLAQARSSIGPHCDPTNPLHAADLRVWLNKWICRIRVPSAGELDPFVANLADWWIAVRASLPDESARLAALTDCQLYSIAAAYGSLAPLTAAINRNGKSRTFGPTATAKVLYFVRPLAVTAWDKAISAHVPGHGSPAFLEHLRRCRAWANALIAEAIANGLDEDLIGPSVGRPVSSVAKLIDEWLYRTVTEGAEVGPAAS
jgi:hypothetical protein